MSKGTARLLVMGIMLAGSTAGVAQNEGKQKLDRDFQAAVSAYHAGQYSEAARQLEALLPSTPDSFEVHELLGLVYGSLNQPSQSIEQLETAVRLQPDSAPARTNLAASLSRAGNLAAAGEQFQKALALEPHQYSANHNLAEFYIQSGKVAEARPFLEEAQRLRPDAYDNGYDLALADFMTGHLAEARQTAQALVKEKNTGELHNLLGQIEEKDGKFVAAATEFGTAAKMDPSDDNLFNWGSEFLLHRTYEPAIDVFRQATQRYPDSPRLEIGLGMALYARGIYEEAIDALLKAADLNPNDPRCYLFLFKAYDRSPKRVEEVIARFKRYAELQPQNGMAQYYYATALWKGRRLAGGDVDLPLVESLLKKAVALDGTIADAHVQLGDLYADQHEYDKSIPEFERALELNPNLPDARYHLGTDYVHIGQKDRAKTEFALSEKLRAQHLAEVDKERAEVEQFIVSAKDVPSTKP